MSPKSKSSSRPSAAKLPKPPLACAFALVAMSHRGPGSVEAPCRVAGRDAPASGSGSAGSTRRVAGRDASASGSGNAPTERRERSRSRDGFVVIPGAGFERGEVMDVEGNRSSASNPTGASNEWTTPGCESSEGIQACRWSGMQQIKARNMRKIVEAFFGGRRVFSSCGCRGSRV